MIKSKHFTQKFNFAMKINQLNLMLSIYFIIFTQTILFNYDYVVCFLLIPFGVIERLQGRPSLLYNMYMNWNCAFLSFFQLQTATTTEKEIKRERQPVSFASLTLDGMRGTIKKPLRRSLPCFSCFSVIERIYYSMMKRLFWDECRDCVEFSSLNLLAKREINIW